MANKRLMAVVGGRQIRMPNILAFSSKNGHRLIALHEGILEKIFTCKMLDLWSKQSDHDIANLEMWVIMQI